MKRIPVSRRSFMGSLLAAGAAPWIIPAHVLGEHAPSNKITIGAVGLGSQGTGDLKMFLGLDKTARVVALCDCNRRHLDRAAGVVKEMYGSSDGVKTYGDFRELVSLPEVDAVQVTTNLHWHALISLAAIRNGKHVFQEKPLAASVEEGQAIAEAVHKKGVVFQLGYQRRGGNPFRWAGELALNGRLGKIREVLCSTVGNTHWDFLPERPVPDWMDWNRWCGPAPLTPFNERKLGIWPTELMSQYSPNGMFQCWGVHYLDLAQFGLMRQAEMPVEVEGMGAFPPTGSSMTDTVNFWRAAYTYADGLKLIFVDNTNEYDLVHGVRFVGERGWAQGEDRGFKSSIAGIERDPACKLGAMPIVLPSCRGNVIADFIDTLRAGRKECLITQIDGAKHSDWLAHIGMHAIKLGRKLHFDVKTETYINDDEANAMLKHRPFRDGWKLERV